MLTFEEARALVKKFVDEGNHSVPVMINDEATEEYDFGWLFYVNSRRYIETGDFSNCLVGAGPIFVERETGRTIHTGSGASTEHLVEAYRATGDPHAERERVLRLSVKEGAQVDRRKIALTYRSITACALSDALARADRCLAGEEERLEFGSSWEASEELLRVREQLEAVGVEVTQRWRARS